jgi:hypothetical protein
MLLYAYLNRYALPTLYLEKLQERVIPIYPFLADRLLMFLAEAKYGRAVKSTILFVQAIKQAVLSYSPSNNDYYQPIPRVWLWNTNFRVIGETQIFTDSNVNFWCHAILSDTEFIPNYIEMQNSDDEEGDVDLLIGRKKRKNDGDSQILPAAHTPYYPQVYLQPS